MIMTKKIVITDTRMTDGEFIFPMPIDNDV